MKNFVMAALLTVLAAPALAGELPTIAPKTEVRLMPPPIAFMQAMMARMKSRCGSCNGETCPVRLK